MSVKFITLTPDAEATMAYIARVSSPHQDNPKYAKLLKYCLDHGHFSVFEHAYMTVEITTSRSISAQILRHRSFTFSEFSQRYAEPTGYVVQEGRKQAKKNRQSSTDDLPEVTKTWWDLAQSELWGKANALYNDAVEKGVAKECARAILPMNTQTRLYMTGSVRSWLHYILLRTQPDTQAEHRRIAVEIMGIFTEKLPTVAEALGWT